MRTSFCIDGWIADLAIVNPAVRATMKAHGQDLDEAEHQALCRCGWEGTRTARREVAEFQLRQHQAEKPREVK